MTLTSQTKLENDSINSKLNEEFNKTELFSSENIFCFICKCFLSEPYIRCVECVDVTLCPQCFAKGREKSDHQNNHSYTIIQNDFSIIDGSDWSAIEEKNLLNLIEICGFGNWISISKKLPGRSPEECEKHYTKNYIDQQSLPSLPKFKSSVIDLLNSEPIPFAFTLKNTDQPPRFTFDNPNYNHLAGYNAARSDFEINHNNDAEFLVCNLKYEDFTLGDINCQLGKALQLVLFNSYNMFLKERARRRKIIRDHGLISKRKGLSQFQKYNSKLSSLISDRFIIFSQLTKGIEFDAIILSLQKMEKLKNYIRELKNYRMNGIQYFHSIPLFQEISEFRNESNKLKKLYPKIEISDLDNISNTAIKNTIIPIHNSKRKKAAPIEIHAGMSGFNEISPVERKLCSEQRIIPKDYISMKFLLMSENERYGCVKLAKARQLLKIDVNKTREIHKLLGEEGYININ